MNENIRIIVNKILYIKRPGINYTNIMIHLFLEPCTSRKTIVRSVRLDNLERLSNEFLFTFNHKCLDNNTGLLNFSSS